MLTFGLDVDNVLSESMLLWLQFYSEDSGVKHTMDEIKKYTLMDDFPVSYDYVMNTFGKVWNAYRWLPVTEANLKEKVTSLQKLGRVVIVTNNAFPDKVLEWLAFHQIPYDEFRSDKNWQFDKASHKDVDILIDDKPELAESCVKNGKILFLYSQPWNQEVNDGGMNNVFRITSLAEIPRILEWRQVK